MKLHVVLTAVRKHKEAGICFLQDGRSNRMQRTHWRHERRRSFYRFVARDHMWCKRCKTVQDQLKNKVDCIVHCGDRDSVFGITTRYGLDGPRIETHWRQKFPGRQNRPPRPNQPSAKWVPGVSRANHSFPSSVGLRVGWSCACIGMSWGDVYLYLHWYIYSYTYNTH
jgi:hypothetical protein